MCIERNIVIFVAVLLVVIFGFMTYNKRAENFEGEVKLSPIFVPEEGPKVIVKPETSTIISGAGSESGEVDGVDQSIVSKIPSNYFFLDDGADGKYTITSNLFSKSCCSAQYPVPFHLKDDPYVAENKSNYVGSNYFGSNSFEDSGCLCLNKQQGQFLYNRGGNGREFF
jgi:hypothetical protein